MKTTGGSSSVGLPISRLARESAETGWDVALFRRCSGESVSVRESLSRIADPARSDSLAEVGPGSLNFAFCVNGTDTVTGTIGE